MSHFAVQYNKKPDVPERAFHGHALKFPDSHTGLRTRHPAILLAAEFMANIHSLPNSISRLQVSPTHGMPAVEFLFVPMLGASQLAPNPPTSFDDNAKIIRGWLKVWDKRKHLLPPSCYPNDFSSFVPHIVKSHSNSIC